MSMETRTAFIRQPARVLLVDYQPPFDADTCEYLHQSLVDFFSLLSHLNGPCRAPLFGLFALGRYPENLFQLQHVKGNFPRLHAALEELKFFAKESLAIPNTTEVLLQGFQDAVAQFKRQSQSLRQMSTFSSELELTVLTCTKPASLSNKIERISRSLDLGSIKKIQIAAVVGNLGDEDDSSAEQEATSSNSTDAGFMGCGLVDTITLHKDPMCFQNFFKTWLLDCQTDQEHIRIVLPRPFSNNQDDDMSTVTRSDNNLILRCDLHERLVNPNYLPHHSQFEMNTECTSTTTKTLATSKTSAKSYPVHSLSVSKLIKAEAICESVLFGMPYIVRPTVCWKLDWEELESNQQHFYAFCNALRERDLVILLKTQTVESPSGSGPCYPVGHFVVLPSEGGTMLLKSIATNELMLPADFSQPSEGPGNEAVEAIAACLDQHEVEDSFNPLLVSCDLYKCLASQALKSSGSASRPQKRRFQPPQRYQQNSRPVATNGEPRQPQTKQRSAIRAPAKRVVFSKEGGPSKTTKRSRAAPALDIYVTSPPDFPDDL